jgi:hypothetical protein
MNRSCYRKTLLLALTGALSLLCINAHANPGVPAMDCISKTESGPKVIFTNNCGQQAFVFYCGDLKYSKKKCGNGGGFYNHSMNLQPGQSNDVPVEGSIRWGSCLGGVGFGKDEFSDSPGGGKDLSNKKHSNTEDVSKLTPQPKMQSDAGVNSLAGEWLLETAATGNIPSGRVRLLLNDDGTGTFDGQFPVLWKRQNKHVSLKMFANQELLRRNSVGQSYEMELDGSFMKGAQYSSNATYDNLTATATRK